MLVESMLCLRVQKKCTRDVSEVTTMFAGSKECIRDSVGCSLCLRVHKNLPAMLFGCSLCLWVQKNAPADRAEWLCLKCCHALLLAA